ncbi:MAG TPA: NUDIX hydrolase [Candidatus Methylomirabilis sp.]|nr:NUDIX hydrolase [Candidatus Methylomirabilis sp.]
MSPPSREYPDAPRAGVGAVVLDGDQVLLVRRGGPPSQGKWSIPGGLIHLGERIEDAVHREVEEECGLRVQLLGLCGVIDRIVQGESDPATAAPIRYHYIIVDYVAAPAGGTLRAGSDAAEARWVPVADLPRYETTDGLAAMIQRAVKLRQASAHGGLTG